MRSQLVIGSMVLGLALSAGAQLASSHGSSAALPPAQVSAPAPLTGKPVVKVNSAVLTDRDLLREMYAIFPYARQHNGFPKSMEADIRKGALDMIVFEELVYQEALRRKMTVPASRVDKAELEFKRQFPSQAVYNEYLKVEMKGSRQVLREKVRRSLLIEALLKSEVTAKSAVTLAEARSYYDKHPERFARGESFTIQTISILPPEKDTPENRQEQRKRAEEAARQAKATKNYEEFGLLAEKISDDDFRVNMGDHHAVGLDKLPPEIVKMARTMKPGQVSDLMQLGNAFTVFRLNAYTPAGKVTFEEAKKDLVTGLQKAKADQLRSNLAKNLRKHSTIQVL